MKKQLHSSPNPNADSRNKSESLEPNLSLIATVEKINHKQHFLYSLETRATIIKH